MENNKIISVSTKYKNKDYDIDFRLDALIAVQKEENSNTSILLRFANGFSYSVPTKIGLQIAKIWQNGKEVEKIFVEDASKL